MSVAQVALQPEQILRATEAVLRRYGPAKTTVADVARELQVSPAAIFRHFPSKIALREAVTRDWLRRIGADLPAIAASAEPAPARLRRWLTALYTAKKATVVEDPELFSTYAMLIAQYSVVEDEHIAALLRDLRTMVGAGVESGEFAVADVDAAAVAVFSSTVRFHNPQYARQWDSQASDDAFAAVVDLVLAGLTAR